MIKTNYIKIFSVLVLWIFSIILTQAAGIYDAGTYSIPASATANVIGRTPTTITGAVTWKMTGDCKIWGMVTIANGASLTILSSDGNQHTIYNNLKTDNDNNTSCFNILPGGTLKIDNVHFSGLQEGTEANTFPGSIADYQAKQSVYDANMVVIPESFITAYGTLEVTNSKFENFRFKQALIDFFWDSKTRKDYPTGDPGYGTFTDCEFKYNINASLTDDKLSTSRVSCINIRKYTLPETTDKNNPINHETKGVAIHGCRFEKNLGAGTVRSYGAGCVDLTIDKSEKNDSTVFSGNQSFLCGGAIYWSAHASSDNSLPKPVLTIGNVLCEHNYAEARGGALMIEGNAKFEAPCEFRYNKSPRGGACSLVAYGNKNVTETQPVNLKFDMKNCNIHDNTATKYGGGIHVDISYTCVLVDGSKIESVLSGLTIKDNKAPRGGGIAVSNSLPENNKKKIIYTNTVTGCTILNNAATDEEKSDDNNNIEDVADGGGVYVYNATLSLENTTIQGNSAANGGGIACLNKGVANYTNGLITENTATGLGGGFYISGDSELYLTKSSDTNSNNDFGVFYNLADTAGDDVYLDPGSSVLLPKVENMTVDNNEDENNSIHKVNWFWDKEEARYRKNGSRTPSELLKYDKPNTLVALTIGWDWVVDIIKKFVPTASRGEDTRSTSVTSSDTNRLSSIVDIYEKPQSGKLDDSAKPYMTIPLTASDEIGNGDTRYRKRVILHNGNWLFKERNWGWTSEATSNSVERSIFPYKTVGEETVRVTTVDAVEFVNTIKEDLVPNDENFIRNKLEISTSN